MNTKPTYGILRDCGIYFLVRHNVRTETQVSVIRGVTQIAAIGYRMREHTHVYRAQKTYESTCWSLLEYNLNSTWDLIHGSEER